MFSVSFYLLFPTDKTRCHQGDRSHVDFVFLICFGFCSNTVNVGLGNKSIIYRIVISDEILCQILGIFSFPG